MEERTQSAAPIQISPKARVFILITVILGGCELSSLFFRMHSIDTRRFLFYFAIVAITSFFQFNHNKTSGFSLNLPFLLLSIVDLSLPEAVAIGCTAILIQGLRSIEHLSFRRLMLSLSVQATIISIASFVLNTFLPPSLMDAPVRLFIAGVALFVANTFPAAVLLRLESDRRLGTLWRKSYFWTFPYYLVAAALAQSIHLGRPAISSQTSLLVLAALYLAYRHYRAQKAEWALREKHAEEMNALHIRAIEGLALAVEAKDNLNTRGHIRRVQVYALAIGKAMGLSEPELQALQAGALLHDIGKLAVPEHILTKPGKLTPEEFAKMKVHPLVGAEIVEQMQFPYAVAPIVRAHHEKWDGSGYPFGLSGENIPISARILTVSDWLDALTSDRDYRPGMPLEDVMRQISAEAGRSFDPKVVEALKGQYKELGPLAKMRATQGPVLSTDVLVEKGAAPDAGLDLCGLPHGASSGDFLTTINTVAREEQLVREMALAGAIHDPSEIMTRISDVVRARVPCEALVLFARRANSLNAEVATGWSSGRLLSLEIPLGDGLTGWVAQNRQPVVNGNPAVDPGFRCETDEPLNSVLSIPLSAGDNLVGVLSLYRTKQDTFTRAELQLLSAAAANIAAALRNASARREMERQANLDVLTGLLNRDQLVRFLDHELKRARRIGEPVALLVAELPDVSRLADSVAHQLLIAISKGLQKTCREGDLLGRIAANRFALVLPGMKPANMVGMVARLHEVAAEAGTLVGEPELRMKLGGAFYPNDSDGGAYLLSVAEGRLGASSQHWEESLEALDKSVSSGSESGAMREVPTPAVTRETADRS